MHVYTKHLLPRGEILLNLTLASFDTGFRGNAPLPRVFKPIHGADDMTELEEVGHSIRLGFVVR